MLFDKIKKLIQERKQQIELERKELDKKMKEHRRIENELNDVFSQAKEFNTGAYMIMLYRINNTLSNISKRLDSFDNLISPLEKTKTNIDCENKNQEQT